MLFAASLCSIQADEVPFRARAPRVSFRTPHEAGYVWDRAIVVAERHGVVLARDEPSHFLMFKTRYEELGLDYYASVVIESDAEHHLSNVSCLSSIPQYRFIEGCDRFLDTLEADIK
jgi:hypothetical protein